MKKRLLDDSFTKALRFFRGKLYSHYCKISHLTNWFFCNVIETFYMRNAKFKYKQILASVAKFLPYFL